MDRATYVQADAASTRPAPESAVPTSTEDLRRAYYSGPGADWFWWVVEIDLDPAQLIVENDNDGKLYRVPYSVSGSGEVTFGEAVVVQVDYVDAPAAASPGARRVAAAQALGRRIPLQVFASKAESRPAASTPPATPEDQPVTPEQLALLGLPADATAEQINARLTELAAAAEGNEPEPTNAPEPSEGNTPPATAPTNDPVNPAEETTTSSTGVTVPDGTVLVDAEQWAEVQRQAAAGAQVAATLQTQSRDQFLQEAVVAGKFAPARLAHWRDAWDKDPEGTRATIESLADGLIPVAMRGHGQAPEAGTGAGGQEAYPSHWLPEVAAGRRSIFNAETGGVG